MAHPVVDLTKPHHPTGLYRVEDGVAGATGYEIGDPCCAG